MVSRTRSYSNIVSRTRSYSNMVSGTRSYSNTVCRTRSYSNMVSRTSGICGCTGSLFGGSFCADLCWGNTFLGNTLLRALIRATVDPLMSRCRQHIISLYSCNQLLSYATFSKYDVAESCLSPALEVFRRCKEPPQSLARRNLITLLNSERNNLQRGWIRE
jgi:hypothetical protein